MTSTDEVAVEDLCKAIGKGKEFDAAGKRISARLIRNLALSLPLEDGGEPCPVPAGIEIYDAWIGGRVQLGNVAAPNGVAVGALAFRKCTFEGGFSGAHGRFRRLSFNDCLFRNAPPESANPEPGEVGLAPSDEQAPDGPAAAAEPPQPMIDLSGTTIDSDLAMDDVRPERPETDYLWIRAPGAHIAGTLYLNRACLRAPPEPSNRRSSDLHVEALTLSLAQIGGDIWFVGGRSMGRINGRGLRVGGDVWMSGAELRNEEATRVTLFLQAAHIGGVLMLNGLRETSEDGTEVTLPFQSHGELNLLAVDIGVSLILEDVDLYPGKGDADGPICLKLSGATIGNSVQIGLPHLKQKPRSRLRGRLLFMRMEIKSQLILTGADLGDEPGAPHKESTVDFDRLVARHVKIVNVMPLRLDPGLGSLEPVMRRLSVSIQHATVGCLDLVGCRLTGDFKAHALQTTGDVVLHARIAGKVELEAVKIGGSLDLSELRMDGDDGRLSLKDGTIAGTLCLSRGAGPGESRPPTLQRAWSTELRCLPGTRLIETLWLYESPEGERLCQVAFLERKGMIRVLDRNPDTLDRFVASYGHGVHDKAAAAEYFRLFCAYGPTERRARWVIAGTDPASIRKKWRLQEAVAGAAAIDAQTGGPAPATSAPVRSLADLGPDDFRVQAGYGRVEPAVRHYEVRACLLLDERLLWVTCDVAVGSNHVKVSGFASPEIGPPLADVPVSDGEFTDHSQAGRARGDWVTPPALGRAKEERDEDELVALDRRLRPHLRSGFHLRGDANVPGTAAPRGIADLRGLSCDTLADEGGRLWGRQVWIRMSHFVYRHALWDPEVEGRRKPTFHRFRDWLRRVAAERLWPPSLGSTWAWPRSFGWLEFGRRWRDRTDYWATWQDRRNWLYQQFPRSARLPCRSRHLVDEFQYAPQPFEQAIKVARAEGREDFATNFEMLKHRVEWRLFNRNARWRLAPLAIAFGAAWLIYNGGSVYGTLAALVATWLLMAGASSTRGVVNQWIRWAPASARALLTELVFYVPAFFGLYLAAGWRFEPFHFFVAFLVYLGIRFVSVFAHGVMRFGFGYLRRPVRAIVTLILAFLIGWWGVHVANKRGMLVIDAQPVADLAVPDSNATFPDDHGMTGHPVLMGSQQVEEGPGVVRELSCAATISEPLYALDVLIPLVDLREESRCEVRRVPEPGEEHTVVDPATLSGSALWAKVPALPLNDNRFWWWIKALYAIAGWVIVSLALLTFAQVNKTHVEPPTEHK